MNRRGKLWLKTSKKGDKFMSGYVEIAGNRYDVLVFKNNRKRPDKKDADYEIFESEPREDREPERSAPRADDFDSGDVPF